MTSKEENRKNTSLLPSRNQVSHMRGNAVNRLHSTQHVCPAVSCSLPAELAVGLCCHYLLSALLSDRRHMLNRSNGRSLPHQDLHAGSLHSNQAAPTTCGPRGAPDSFFTRLPSAVGDPLTRGLRSGPLVCVCIRGVPPRRGVSGSSSVGGQSSQVLTKSLCRPLLFRSSSRPTQGAGSMS